MARVIIGLPFRRAAPSGRSGCMRSSGILRRRAHLVKGSTRWDCNLCVVNGLLPLDRQGPLPAVRRCASGDLSGVVLDRAPHPIINMHI